MKLSEFYYDLPKSLIAQHPLPSRDNSRLMILDRKNSSINHNTFYNFPNYFYKGDLLVLNNTKVFPAKLIGKKKNTGGKVEILLTQETEPGIWEAMIKSSGKLKENTEITFSLSGFSAVIVGEDKSKLRDKEDGTQRLIQFNSEESAKNILDKVGLTPLPPYIKRNQGKPSSTLDKERYQTVYASKSGAIAAPTAGLHFTEDILNRLRKKGVEVVEVTLHVGTGTFKPVKTEFIEQHTMDPEYFEIDAPSAKKIKKAVSEKRRIIAAGTTPSRTIESIDIEGDSVTPLRGRTDLFIYPGFNFRFVNALLTNFHLPGSTLLMLVYAFAGKKLAQKAYREAIERKYRFYSYGDAMLIL
tara:strand:+ start:3490 stop:4557 length:1068 start_codon:yes stop_codon:yes gene_type:complete